MIHAFQTKEIADQQECVSKRLEHSVKATKQKMSRMNKRHNYDYDPNLQIDHSQVDEIFNSLGQMR